MPDNFSKYELRSKMKISETTLSRWLKLFEPELIALGYRRRQKVFTPKQWHFVLEKLGEEK